MGKINSKNKGSEYELKIAKILSKWWGEEFHRTPMSGGLHWKNDNRVAGDIVTPPNSVFPYSVECKKRESWKLDDLMKNNTEIDSYWSQCVRDAKAVKLRPLLIFSKNFYVDLIMLSMEDFFCLADKCPELKEVPYILYHTNERNRVIVGLQDFIEKVSKEDLISAYNL